MTEMQRKFGRSAGAVAWALVLAAGAWAQSGSVEGVVRDAGKRSVVDARVSLDDQVAGRTVSTRSDAEGHFRFMGVEASTYMLRVEQNGYLEKVEGPFGLNNGEKKLVDLQLVRENDGSAGKSLAEGIEYTDEPKFTVAGVSDPSNVGGHGSNVTLPTKEALAKETASLGVGGVGGEKVVDVTPGEGELPKIATGDFAGNLRAGKELLQAGRAIEAVGYLERAAQLKPEDYDAGYSLALAYQRNGATKRAEPLVRALLARGDRAELHALLGQVEESEGQPLEAVREFQRAAEMEPNEEHLFLWGAELLLHHAYEPAAEVFAKGHRVDAKSIRILVGMGTAAYAQDLNEQAARWLLEASELAPADPRPYEFLGKVQEVAKSEPPEWVVAFRRYVTLQPGNAAAHYFYAVALEKRRRGKEDLAAREEHLRRAIAIEPKMGEAYLKMGVLEAEKKEFAKAVESLQRAVEYTELPDEAHLRLAQVYRQMGEMEKAGRESLLYNEVAEKKKEERERERRELGEFVYTVPGEKP
jgi:tetratricopeptide (TPR) repeat protein